MRRRFFSSPGCSRSGVYQPSNPPPNYWRTNIKIKYTSNTNTSPEQNKTRPSAACLATFPPIVAVWVSYTLPRYSPTCSRRFSLHADYNTCFKMGCTVGVYLTRCSRSLDFFLSLPRLFSIALINFYTPQIPSQAFQHLHASLMQIGGE